MFKLFEIDNKTRKKHKKSFFGLGGGAKFPKKLAQKLLAVAVCTAMVLLGVPLTGGRYVAAEIDSPLVLTLTKDESDNNNLKLTGLQKLRGMSNGTAKVKFKNSTTHDDDFVGLKVGYQGSWIRVDQEAYVEAGPDVPVLVSVGKDLTSFCMDKGHFISYHPMDSSGIFCCHGDVSDGLLVWIYDDNRVVENVYFPDNISATRDRIIPELWFFSADQLAMVDPNTQIIVNYGSEGDEYAYETTDLEYWPTKNQGGEEAPEAQPVTPGGLGAGGQSDNPSNGEGVDNEQAAQDDNLTTPSANRSVLTTAVQVNGCDQRLMVVDKNSVLPDDAAFEAKAVTSHAGLDGTHEAEHLLSYDLRLLNANGDPIAMPLAQPVELWFEVVDGLDVKDLEVVLVNTLGADSEFEERLEERDGKTWVVVTTDHFSPYALIDKLTDEEQAALRAHAENNVKTGDTATAATVACLGMVLVMALGVMLRLVNTKRFDA